MSALTRSIVLVIVMALLMPAVFGATGADLYRPFGTTDPGTTAYIQSTGATSITGGLDPTVKAFLDRKNAEGGQPLHKMSTDKARAVLSDEQASTPVPMMPASIEEIDIPGGPTGKVHVHIVRPQGSTGQLPVTIYIHGGGWMLGDFQISERTVRALANKSGSAVVFVDYTSTPEAKYPVALEESYRVLEYVAQNGSQHGLDGSRIAIAGDSAGGNMATVVAIMAKERKGPPILFQVLFYLATDTSFDTESFRQFAEGYWLSAESVKWFLDQYLPDKEARKDPTVSPLRASVDQLSGLPPALVVTCEYDILRDEGEAYARKLADAGVPTTAVRFPGTIHDMVILNALADTPAAKGAVDMASSLLRGAFASQ